MRGHGGVCRVPSADCGFSTVAGRGGLEPEAQAEPAGSGFRVCSRGVRIWRGGLPREVHREALLKQASVPLLFVILGCPHTPSYKEVYDGLLLTRRDPAASQSIHLRVTPCPRAWKCALRCALTQPLLAHPLALAPRPRVRLAPLLHEPLRPRPLLRDPTPPPLAWSPRAPPAHCSSLCDPLHASASAIGSFPGSACLPPV